MDNPDRLINISCYSMNIPITIPLVNGYIERSTVEAIMMSINRRVLDVLAKEHLLEEDK